MPWLYLPMQMICANITPFSTSIQQHLPKVQIISRIKRSTCKCV